MVSLSELYQALTAAELKERQDFLLENTLGNLENALGNLENTLGNRLRSATPEVWERTGLNFDKVLPNLREASALVNLGPCADFQRAFFSKLVPNVRKLGLLDANAGYLRRQRGEAGMLEFEFADDTATDFESEDAVGADRAAAAAARA